MSRIYLDYNATTPTDPRVAAVVMRHMTEVFGNPSSSDHSFGDEARRAVETAIDEVRLSVQAGDARVVFTSGSTEGANLTLRGLVGATAARRDARLRIGLMPVEHPAVLETCRDMAAQGVAELSFVEVDDRGRIDLESLQECCSRGLDLVCAMAANNEIGTIYPLKEIAAIAHGSGALVFCDATQAAGKVAIDMDRWGVDFLVLSAHKMYGPKGAGALLLGRGLGLRRVVTGGAQQFGMRGGTLNTPGIAGLGEACRLRRLEMEVDERRHETLRDGLEAALCDAIPDLVVNGDLANRLPGTLHVCVDGVPNAAVIARLRDRVAISTGSACSSGIESPSHVLRAIGLKESLQAGALRLSLGKFTIEEELGLAVSLIADTVAEVRRQLG